MSSMRNFLVTLEVVRRKSSKPKVNETIIIASVDSCRRNAVFNFHATSFFLPDSISFEIVYCLYSVGERISSKTMSKRVSYKKFDSVDCFD